MPGRNRGWYIWPLALLLLVPIPALASHSGIGVFVDESSRIPFAPVSRLSQDVEWVDVDQDSDLDVWVALGTASGAGGIDRLFFNDGLGNFTSGSLPRRSDDSTDVGVGDVDADGDLDVIVANVGRENLYINRGTGSFSLQTSSRLPPPPSDPLEDTSIAAEFVDVDLDGDLDIAVANERPGAAGAQNFLWINDGTGRFVDETTTRFPAQLDQTSGLAFGDIDGDGDPDVVVVNNGQNFVLINDGAGFFRDETALRYPTLSASGRHGVLTDVDLDGDLDLYLATSRQQADRLFLNSLGVFTEVTTSHMPGVIDSTIDVDLADLDGDGDVDAYAANVGSIVGNPLRHVFTGEQDRLYENDGAGRFIDITTGHIPGVVDGTFGASIGDADGDGDLDIVTANQRNELLRLYLQS